MATADELARDFDTANSEAVDFARSCTPEQWLSVTSEEGWTVAATVHHIALRHELISGWIDALRRGEPVEGLDDVDEVNAEHAAEYARAGVEETVRMLEEKGADTAAVIRSLSQAELLRSGAFGGGPAMTCEQAAQAAADHVRSHLAHAQAAAGLDPG